MRTCSCCGRDIIRSDTDDLYYHEDDLEWYVRPDEDDPGVLGPKEGALPFPECIHTPLELRV